MIPPSTLAARLAGLLLVTLGWAVPIYGQTARPGDRPNIVVIVADDMGYADIGAHGCRDIPTPHIDSIARGGVRCSSGYVSAPQCAPTRAGLLTGRYQQRFGYEHNSALPDGALPLTETTVADRLKAAGYATGLVGKWHLGSDDRHRPESRGFGEFFGFLGGSNPYLPRGNAGVPRIVRGRGEVREQQYLTDAFGREAVAFVDRHQKEPFFLYLAFNAPHGPMEAPPERLKRFEAIADEKRRTYAAMMSAMDDAIGGVLAKLKAAGLEENTLVFFTNDNGGPTSVNASSNAPFRGVKGEVWEGGIRVPFLARWPGRLPAGKVYDRPVITLDLHPTLLAAAGVTVPPDAKLDGVNLLPHLSGQQAGDPHEVLYWRFNFPPNQPALYKWAIRQGDWKLLADVEPRGGGQAARAAGQEGRAARPTGGLKLVNLATDVHEDNDLSAQHPEKVKAMEAAWKRWNAEMITPPATAEDAPKKDNPRKDKPGKPARVPKPAQQPPAGATPGKSE